jgi:hypothetical protein
MYCATSRSEGVPGPLSSNANSSAIRDIPPSSSRGEGGRTFGHGAVFPFLICFLCVRGALVNLLSVGASLCESGLAPRGLAQHDIAVPTQHDRLGVAEDGGNLEASGALDVHEEGIG